MVFICCHVSLGTGIAWSDPHWHLGVLSCLLPDQSAKLQLGVGEWAKYLPFSWACLPTHSKRRPSKIWHPPCQDMLGPGLGVSGLTLTESPAKCTLALPVLHRNEHLHFLSQDLTFSPKPPQRVPIRGRRDEETRQSQVPGTGEWVVKNYLRRQGKQQELGLHVSQDSKPPAPAPLYHLTSLTRHKFKCKITAKDFKMANVGH